jgi:DNA modification methylase
MIQMPTESEPVVVVEGDCLEVMPRLPADSFDAIATDPPYGLSFMGREWDHGVPGVPFWDAALRVLKPGGYMVAMGGTRTHHRLMVAIEDAGFEIRDCLMWVYGSGFPKGKGCLKPAWEPIILARKPGAKVLPLGVDECRIPTNGERMQTTWNNRGNAFGSGRPRRAGEGVYDPSAGRYPANLVHDGSDEVMEAFAAFGERKSSRPGGTYGTYEQRGENAVYGKGLASAVPNVAPYGDTGSAARFFYAAKASKSERGSDNSHPTVKPLKLCEWLVRLICPVGGLVLDPFGGSGTTGKAAAEEGRRAIIIEREPTYAAIARRRVAEAMGTGLLAGLT